MAKIIFRRYSDGIDFYVSNTGMYKIRDEDREIINLGEIPGFRLPGSYDPNKMVSALRNYINKTDKEINRYERKLKESIGKKQCLVNMLNKVESIVEKIRIPEKADVNLVDE